MCMENIQITKRHKYSADKMANLIEHEEKCKEKMKHEKVSDSEDDAWNFFQLSCTANKKIPFYCELS